MHVCVCVSMCVCLHALGGVAQALKMDPSGQALSGRVPVEGSVRLGDEDDDDEVVEEQEEEEED